MRVNSRTRPQRENASYWTSYSDMMAGLMLVFALIMFFSIFQFIELQETKAAELSEKEVLLLSQQTQLDTQQSQLSSQSLTLEQQRALLATQQQELAAAQQQLAIAQTAAQQQQTQLDQQSLQLSAQQTQMQQQQQRIDALIGVRARIIETLRDELAKARLDVAVDQQTGAIALKGAVLFDVGKSELKPSGMALLDTFIPLYVRTLLAPANSAFVGEIIIEGHADTDGEYFINLDLSQRRAFAVAQYCLQSGFGGLTGEESQKLREIMTANGRSWSNPVRDANGNINKEASRRVEFKFRLKDAEMITELSAIMEQKSVNPQ